VKHILEPLTRVAGVRIAALITSDGVPITVHQAPRRRRDEQSDAAPGSAAGADDVSELAGLATSWIGEVSRAVAPLSWDAPKELVLRAARGTLIVKQAPRALLLVMAEELRLPMQVAVARMERHLRDIDSKNPSTSSDVDQMPGIFPAQTSPHARESGDTVQTIGNRAPEVSGE
jgi:predicted regulator of Ras-like GTPase activity (Roadblock/LC7/MglB family)